MQGDGEREGKKQWTKRKHEEGGACVHAYRDTCTWSMAPAAPHLGQGVCFQRHGGSARSPPGGRGNKNTGHTGHARTYIHTR